MMLFACVTFLATTALALPAGDMGMGMGIMDMMTTDQPAPPMCCLPKTWQATLIDMKSSTALQYVILYATDGDKKVDGYVTVPMDGGAPVSQIYTDYNSMTTYSVGSDGKCAVSKATHVYYESCAATNMSAADLSAAYGVTNMKWIGTTTLGTSVKYDGYHYNLGPMEITIALSKDGCIPLVEAVKQDDDQAKIDSIFLFNDVSTTITDTYILAMPAACVSSVGAGVGKK